jgi:hypothetical protein
MSSVEQRLAANLAEWRAQRAQIGRPVKEWIGKDAAQEPPERIRHRVAETFGWVCYLSGQPISKAKGFDLEHVVSIREGGAAANRESNLRPAERAAHKDKTRREKKEQALADRKARAAAGTKAAPKQEIKSAPAPVRPPQKGASAKIDEGKVGALRVRDKSGAPVFVSAIARRFRDA